MGDERSGFYEFDFLSCGVVMNMGDVLFAGFFVTFIPVVYLCIAAVYLPSILFIGFRSGDAACVGDSCVFSHNLDCTSALA